MNLESPREPNTLTSYQTMGESYFLGLAETLINLNESFNNVSEIIIV